MAVVMAASQALHLLPILLLLVATNDAATFTISNNCSFTVWPAVVPVGGGLKLNPGQIWTLHVPADTSSSRLWGRTGCYFNSSSHGACQTGDCGGELLCSLSGQPPLTLAEFSLGGATDFFDISVIDGFNLPMDFLGCGKVLRCRGNTTSQCPDAYFSPTDTTKTFSCPGGTNYQVIFCPLMDGTPMPVTVSPQPAPAIQTTYLSPSPGAARARSSPKRQVIMIIAPIGGFIFLSMLFLFLFFICKRGRRRRGMDEAEDFGELQGTPMRFTFQHLKVATEDFRDKLGEGAFGTVFKGQIGEDIVAVKRLDRTGQGNKEFAAEVQTISGIHHINLVRLIGFCAEKSNCLLVYEFMPKESLDKGIYDQQGLNVQLDWKMRCKIITHVAKGLTYLHEECSKRIAHLDVKPQNILLDDNFDAKLADFGLCKLIDRDKSQVITRMRGTPGYLAPEWLTSQITEKADIYSFGVVVMEIISGRKNLDTSRSEASIHLITLLEEKVKNGQIVDLIDENSHDMQAHRHEVIRVMKLAMWCLQMDSKRRPQMSDVVKVLEGNMNVETDIDHTFVATSQTIFGIAGNAAAISSPPPTSNVSGPR
ncbi:hypothetical protein EJB05_15952, partial [Eragrostis curvula]